MDDDEEPFDGCFSTRFSATRLHQVAQKQLSDRKRAVLSKCNFGSLLNIAQFSVPVDIIDWVVPISLEA